MKKKIKSKGQGCMILLVISLIIGAIISIFSPETLPNNQNSTLTAVDSLELKKQERIKDSLLIVNKKKKDKGKRALKLFKKKKDEFEGNTFYRDPRTPYYSNVNFIYPYIGQKGDNYWLRLKFQYASEDWLFINKTILLVDGEKFTVTGNWERDSNSKIWEWLDISVKNNERLILEIIANSKSAKVRYNGSQYYKDRTITRKEKNIIKKTLGIFDNLK